MSTTIVGAIRLEQLCHAQLDMIANYVRSDSKDCVVASNLDKKYRTCMRLLAMCEIASGDICLDSEDAYWLCVQFSEK